ncbi:MAG TPA: hypothetical protein VHA57_03220 [Actinomycetota bacterium]|nr:hypothetical protein [Actinomycetota bacterium]
MSHRRLGAVAAAALALVSVLGLSGCAGPRNSLGPSSTACFKALPPAFDAVGRQGHYAGVRQVSAATLAKRRPEFAGLGKETICVVAFRGNYPPGSVKGAPANRSGEYALVAIDAKTDKEVGATIVAKLPLRFQHPI